MHVNVVRRFIWVAGEFEHRGPEQRVEINDVLADEVNLLGGRIGEKFLEIDARTRAVIFKAREITYRRIQPHIKIFARRVGNRNAEVGRVA